MNKEQLVGTYKLVSWENRTLSGDVVHPMGKDVDGVISYSSDGNVFVHIMANGRKPHSTAEVFGGDIEEIKASATSHLSYFGTYEIEGNEVIHSVQIASFPNWVDSEQRREMEYDNGRLSLSAHGVQVGDDKVSAYLIWQRV